MTAANFPACLAIILKEEGGNDDDPHDHGGRTSRGIIQREWDIWRKGKDLPADVWEAPQEEINAIYREQYWRPYCDDMPAGIDLCFFNASVNSGRQQAVKELQRALGVNADGMFGITSKSALNAVTDLQSLIHKVCEQRRAFYRALKQFSTYGKGWLARTDRVEVAASGMAPVGVAVVPATGSTETLSAKAPPSDANEPAVSVTQASGGSGAATIAAGVTDQLQTLSTALSPMSDTLKWVKIACLIIAVICAGLAIYAVIQHNKTKAVM